MRYVLPGMGATSAMYDGPWRDLSDTAFLDWSDARGATTLDGAADGLIERHAIGPADVLVGSSLGGIVALEIAARVLSRDVVLIGSARTRDEISGLLLALAPLAAVTPMRLVQTLAGKSGGALGAMFAEVDPRFVRNACRDLVKWDAPEAAASRVHRIHGARDHVIPCPPGVAVVAGGGHLIAMTHAAECAAFVRDVPPSSPRPREPRT